ncbi:MAG: type I-G CRISPR-associated helicase/endonuclease Cas3g [Acidimicrobiales bacterium]
MADFETFFAVATSGSFPYRWQRQVAESGLPELVDIETGAGKTAGVVLGWLWRRLRHPDPDVRSSTPAWLVIALPMRSLVEQTARVTRSWLDRAAPEVQVYVLMGGEGGLDARWRERPGVSTVLVGTIDMLLSRALNRGYAASRWVWPLEFGLLHTGTHWVFDEIQLMGPALASSRQLDAFRRRFGSLAPCRSTWMSATVRPDALVTVDNPNVPEPLTLSDEDRNGGLRDRLDATRGISELQSATDDKDLAAAALDLHRRGTRTLVVLNTVPRAVGVYRQIGHLGGAAHAVDLLHSRFRPADRNHIVDRAFSDPIDPTGPGRIFVATQVVEAGVDISSTTLITEAAPWPSIVQRAGRCNRSGRDAGARIAWLEPKGAEPYDASDIANTVRQLRELEGTAVTATDLRLLGNEVPTADPIVPVLRQRDLLQLFDTAPDLIGNDVDISRFIRETDDVDVFVCWRTRAPAGSDEPFLGGPPQGTELCRVPLPRARTWLRGRTAWMPDHRDRRRRWVRLDVAGLRPGLIVVVSADEGGYDPAIGFDEGSKAAVAVAAPSPGDAIEPAPPDENAGDDPATFVGAWVRLADHLGDAQRQAVALVAEVTLPGLSTPMSMAVIRAAALHDLGKAHPAFQNTLLRAMGDDRADVERLAPLAKSGTRASLRHERPFFRHELVSALLLQAHEEALLADLPAEVRALVTYLVAAHHGRVRMAIRAMPNERTPVDRGGARIALGVVDGDEVPAIDMSEAVLPPTVLDLRAMELGGEGSWASMAAALLASDDIGPFRLAGLEALVRLADWRASEQASTATAVNTVEPSETERR